MTGPGIERVGVGEMFDMHQRVIGTNNLLAGSRVVTIAWFRFLKEKKDKLKAHAHKSTCTQKHTHT